MENIQRKQVNQKSNIVVLWIIALILPIVSFFIAIRHFNIKKYRIFILLFGIMYGLTFIPIMNSDGDRYAQEYREMGSFDADQYFSSITKIYSADAQFQDIYVYTLYYLSKRISDDPQVFHFMTALFYFLAYIALMATIREMVPNVKRKYYLWFFLGCVFIMNFSAGVNGVRFAMGFMVFGYGALNLIIRKNIKFLFIALTSILIHFSLIYPSIFLVAFYLLGYPSKSTYLYIFLAFAALSSIFSAFIVDNIDIFGASIESKFNDYTDPNFIRNREQHTELWRWYVQFDKYSTFYFVNIAVLLVRFITRKARQDELAKRLFSFALVMFGASMISGALVDSISNRFILLSNLFSLVYLFYLGSINPYSNFLKRVSRYYAPVFIMHALVIFRADLYTVSPYLIFGNPIFVLFFKSDVSIQDFIIDMF